MFLFILACLYVMAAALVLEATTEEGVLVVSPRVWFLVIAGLGVWLVVLAA
jgi:hypothetical protein